MSVLELIEEKEQKPIEVFCISGDPTWAYEWACVLAQEMYTERGLSVFKTSSGCGDFLKGYAGEECILLTGYLDQDMDLYELVRFFNGARQNRFDNVNLGNVKAIIMTTYQSPAKWEYVEYYSLEEIRDMLYEIDHYIEISDNSTGLARITEESVESYLGARKTTIRENVDIYAILEKQVRDSPCGYFEDIDILKHVVGTKSELEHLSQIIKGFTIFESKKLGAMIDAQYYRLISAKQVEKFISQMDECVYLPYILNDRDNGYDLLNNHETKRIPNYLSLFFDFDAYGKAAIMPVPDTYQMMHVTKYGYIEGIDPWHGIENFE